MDDHWRWVESSARVVEGEARWRFPSGGGLILFSANGRTYGRFQSPCCGDRILAQGSTAPEEATPLCRHCRQRFPSLVRGGIFMVAEDGSVRPGGEEALASYAELLGAEPLEAVLRAAVWAEDIRPVGRELARRRSLTA